MRAVGIVCECNPIHDGHKYLIKQAKSDGAEAVICVMSGCFTQRGEAAVLDPQTRARMLIDGGADAVLELPFPFSSAGAEFFADAGVSILSRLGVNELWFGSECGSIEALQQAATVASGEAFAEQYRALCQTGKLGTAEAYFHCLTDFGVTDRFSSNDLLGIAYLRAIEKRGAPMRPVTVQRQGSGFHDETVREGAFPSASALRRMLWTDGVDAWTPFLSKTAMELAREQIANGRAPFSLAFAERAILSHFRLATAESLESVAELEGGLGHRIAQIARRAQGLDELITESVTKKYTEARVRRGILFSMLGVSGEDLRREPAYAVLLAANRTGCAFLKEQRRTSEIPVVTSHASIPNTEDAKRQETMTERAFAFYTLCAANPLPADAFLRASSHIEG